MKPERANTDLDAIIVGSCPNGYNSDKQVIKTFTIPKLHYKFYVRTEKNWNS